MTNLTIDSMCSSLQNETVRGVPWVRRDVILTLFWKKQQIPVSFLFGFHTKGKLSLKEAVISL